MGMPALRILVGIATFVMALAARGPLLRSQPASWEWMDGPTATYHHYRTVGTLLQNGSVLITGGLDLPENHTTACELYDPLRNTIRPAALMNLPRAHHCVVLLRDGQALAIGGVGDSAMRTCELYNPATDRWTMTGTMNTPRGRACAVLLNDGRVLVAGGIGGSGSQILASAEIYDPATGRWAAAGTMSAGRTAPAMAVLADGRVLVVSGYSYSTTCDLFDPATGQWRATASLIGEPSGEHSLTRLHNGMVLLAGGWGGTKGMLKQCALYDPATESWRATGSLSRGRCDHQAFLLPDGRVMIVGGIDAHVAGQDNTCYALATSEIYDPNAGTWAAGPTLPLEESYFAGTMLPTGLLWCGVGGKRNGPADPELQHLGTFLLDYSVSRMSAGDQLPSPSIWPTLTMTPAGFGALLGGTTDCVGSIQAQSKRYAFEASAWETPAGIPTLAIVGHTATLLATSPPRIMVVGGRSTSALAATTLLINAGDVHPATASAGPSLLRARFEHTATLLQDGSLLIVGGTDGTTPGGIGTVERYNPQSGMDTVATLPEPRFFHTASLLPSGNVLVAGGTSSGTLASCYVYDPACDEWLQTAPMNAPRWGHNATVLPSGAVLVSGGYGASNKPISSCEIYDERTRGWITVGPLATARARHTATLLPTGQVLVSGGLDGSNTSLRTTEIFSPVSRTWRAGSDLPEAVYAHAAAVLPDSRLLICGGITQNAGGCDAARGTVIAEQDFGYVDSVRPVIVRMTPTRTQHPDGERLTLAISGNGFRDNANGASSASNGSTFDAPFNYPVVELRRFGQDRVDGDVLRYAEFDAGNARWTDSSTQVRVALGRPGRRLLPAGWYAVTVIANGVRSRSMPLLVAYNDPRPEQGIVVDSVRGKCLERTFTAWSACGTTIVLDAAGSHNVAMTVDSTNADSVKRVTVRLIATDSTGSYTVLINGKRVVAGTLNPLAATVVTDERSACRQYEFTISSPCDVTSIAIDPAFSTNVELAADPPPPAQAVRVRIRLVDSTRDGRFLARDGSGAVYTGFIERTGLPFVVNAPTGPLTIGQATCDTIAVTNPYSSRTITLANAHLLGNQDFSIPPSQLPMTLAPGETRRLLVCYNPTPNGRTADTLMIDAECDVALIALSGPAVPAFYGTGTNCGATIGFRPASATKRMVVASAPTLDPASMRLRIEVAAYGPADGLAPLDAPVVYNLAGQPTVSMLATAERASASGTLASRHRTFQANLAGVPSGWYVVVVSTPEGPISFPITIAH